MTSAGSVAVVFVALKHCRFAGAPQRPGQGARTDLTYLPGTDGQPVFINPTTITTATLLRDLANTQATT